MMIFPAALPEPTGKPVTATEETEAPAPVPPTTKREADRIPAGVTGVALFVVALILLWAVVGVRIRASAPQYMTIAYPGLFGCNDATLLQRILQLRAENNPEWMHLADAHCKRFPGGARVAFGYRIRGGLWSASADGKWPLYWFHRS